MSVIQFCESNFSRLGTSPKERNGMTDNSIYRDIAKRTGGDIYIGVVGPVRTGKSTFIGRFLDTTVLPNIEDEYDKQRTVDEMPQGAAGKTVMTTEPKFIPDDAVLIKMDGGTELHVKMVDCVGYMVDGALGAEEDGAPRMIKTPWNEEPIPFCEAAELGTGKVIGEHSTIGILVTTDGTVTDIPRESYVEAEERVARELKSLGKPFAIVLNSKNPGSEAAHALACELEEKYGVPVALVSCPSLNSDDIREILGLILGEFPVRELKFTLPSWTSALPESHPLLDELYAKIDNFSSGISKFGDITSKNKEDDSIEVIRLDAGDGTGELSIPLDDDLYFSTLSALTGLDVGDERKLFATLGELSEIKAKYERIEAALADAEAKGYGIVVPSADEMTLTEPRVIKQSGGYAVSTTAHAETIHMIKAKIRTDVCPAVGTEEQTEEIAKYLRDEYDNDPKSVWDYKVFGRTMYDLVRDGMNAKLMHMPDEARRKMGETLERIINEGASGLICILL